MQWDQTPWRPPEECRALAIMIANCPLLMSCSQLFCITRLKKISVSSLYEGSSSSCYRSGTAFSLWWYFGCSQPKLSRTFQVRNQSSVTAHLFTQMLRTKLLKQVMNVENWTTQSCSSSQHEFERILPPTVMSLHVPGDLMYTYAQQQQHLGEDFLNEFVKNFRWFSPNVQPHSSRPFPQQNTTRRKGRSAPQLLHLCWGGDSQHWRGLLAYHRWESLWCHILVSYRILLSPHAIAVNGSLMGSIFTWESEKASIIHQV